MGILAVLVAVGVPFLIRWRTNQELRNSADRVLSAIRLTQSLATRFAHDASEFEVPLAGGESLQEALTGIAPDGFIQCRSLGELGDEQYGGISDGGGTGGSTSGVPGVPPGGGSSSSGSGGSGSSTSSGGGGSAAPPAATGGTAATVCSIALKKSDSWTVYSKEYVDGGITVSLTPIVSFTDADVDASAQSAISVGRARGIAFLANGTLYSRTQTQLQLTASSTGRACVITISPSGGVSMQQ